VARLYPLYLACAAAVLVTIGVGGVGLGTVTAHLTLLHNLLPDRQQAFISVTWTLTLEVLFYAAVPLLAGLILARHRGPVPAATLARWIVLSALASIAWMLGAGALPSSLARTSLFARQLLPSMWSAFCPGLLIALAHLASPDDLVASPILRTVHRLRSHAPSAMAVAFGFAALGFLTFFAQPRWGTTAYLWTYDLGRVCWSVAFAVLVLRAVDAMALPDRTPQALVALGDWSYGIYVIHGTLFTIMLGYGGRALFPMPHGGAPAFLVHVAYLAALTIPLAALSWRFLEKPAMVAARRVGAPPVAPVAAGR
jgi:peptidoglycan/LPS O-acetylase OafA/YrhL